MPERIKKMNPRKAVESRAGGKRKVYFAVSVVVLSCLAIVLGLVFAGGGDKSKSIKAQSSGSAQAQSTPAAATTASTGIEQVEVPPLSIYRRRNPFKPLVNMEEPTVPTTTATTGTGPAGGTVTVPPGLVSGSSNPGDVVSRVTSLEGIYEQDGKMCARIRVADQVFENLATGDIFAEHYKLLSIGADSSATILYGDERIKVYTGQSIYW